MRRIAVIGASGAGKTRLAREFGHALDLPVVPLDPHYYGPGWQPLPLAEWVDRQRQLAAAEHWVMDGNYASTLALRLERADMVVLDLPPLLCAWRILRRWAVGHLLPAADLPQGLRPTVAPQFLAYVLMFRHRRRAALLAQLGAWDRGGPSSFSRRGGRSGDSSPACLTSGTPEHKFDRQLRHDDGVDAHATSSDRSSKGRARADRLAYLHSASRERA